MTKKILNSIFSLFVGVYFLLRLVLTNILYFKGFNDNLLTSINFWLIIMTSFILAFYSFLNINIAFTNKFPRKKFKNLLIIIHSAILLLAVVILLINYNEFFNLNGIVNLILVISLIYLIIHLFK